MLAVWAKMRRAIMMKTNSTACTKTAVITPPAWSKALGMFRRPAPRAAFTIRKIDPRVEEPPWDLALVGRSPDLSWSSMMFSADSSYWPSLELLDESRGGVLLKLWNIETGVTSLL